MGLSPAGGGGSSQDHLGRAQPDDPAAQAILARYGPTIPSGPPPPGRATNAARLQLDALREQFEQDRTERGLAQCDPAFMTHEQARMRKLEDRVSTREIREAAEVQRMGSTYKDREPLSSYSFFCGFSRVS